MNHPAGRACAPGTAKTNTRLLDPAAPIAIAIVLDFADVRRSMHHPGWAAAPWHRRIRQDRGVRTEQIWRHGRPWTALIIGGPAGSLFALFQLDFSGNLGKALLAGLSFGVCFGAAMSILIWSRWKAAKNLCSQDRRAVARSVLKGEPIENPRLAPAVIEYAEVVRHSQDRGRRYRWTLWIWPTLTLAWAVAATVNGSTRQSLFLWALFVFWITSMPIQRRRETKTSSRASRAENSAREVLGD